MVWYSWNSDSTATTTGAWGAWNSYSSGDTQVTVISASSDAWVYWNAGTQQTTSATNVWGYWTNGQYVCGNIIQAPEISQEERQRREADSRRAIEEHNRRQEKTRLEKEAADIKALDLLQDILPEEDFAFYQKHGRLLVKGRKHDYLIQRDSGQVVRLEKDKVADLCMHLEDHHAYSRHDNVIAMKLYLEAKEDEFNREANLHRRRVPQGVEVELMRAVG